MKLQESLDFIAQPQPTLERACHERARRYLVASQQDEPPRGSNLSHRLGFLRGGFWILRGWSVVVDIVLAAVDDGILEDVIEDAR